MTGPVLSIWSVPVASAPQLPAASRPRTEKTWLPSLSLTISLSGIWA